MLGFIWSETQAEKKNGNTGKEQEKTEQSVSQVWGATVADKGASHCQVGAVLRPPPGPPRPRCPARPVLPLSLQAWPAVWHGRLCLPCWGKERTGQGVLLLLFDWQPPPGRVPLFLPPSSLFQFILSALQPRLALSLPRYWLFSFLLDQSDP